MILNLDPLRAEHFAAYRVGYCSIPYSAFGFRYNSVQKISSNNLIFKNPCYYQHFPNGCRMNLKFFRNICYFVGDAFDFELKNIFSQQLRP